MHRSISDVLLFLLTIRVSESHTSDDKVYYGYLCVCCWEKKLVSSIKIEEKIARGVFQERPNRFAAFVKIGDAISLSFLPNPGRMYELLIPGTEVFLRKVTKDKRKNCYDLIGVEYNSQMVSLDLRLPNKLVLEALGNRDTAEISEYTDKARVQLWAL